MPENTAVIAPETPGLDPASISAIATEVARMMQTGQASAPMTQPTQAAQLQHGIQEGNIFRNGPPNIAQGEDISAQTIGIVQNARADIQRSGVNVGTGFIGYDLKTPAAMLVPYMTPLLNMTPREMGVGIDIHNWKAVTDFFGGNGPQSVLGAVADGGTPSFVSYSVTAMSNTFQTIGLQNSETFQSIWRGRQLEGDLRSVLTAQLLLALKLIEENWLINMSDSIWTPPPPLVTVGTTGGSLSSTNPYWVAVTGVTAQGETLPTATLGPFTIPSTSTGVLNVTVFTVPNATKYNIYVATAATKPATSAMWLQTATLWTLRTPDTISGASNQLNQPVSFLQGNFTVSLTGALATSGTALSGVTSNTALVTAQVNSTTITNKGMQSLIYNNTAAPVSTGAGGLKGMISQPAAASGFLVLSDIQNLFLNMYNNSRADPDVIFFSPQDGLTINNLVATNGETRVVVDGSRGAVSTGQMDLTAGFKVTRILNQVTQRLVNMVQLPFLAQGTIVAGSLKFPYPVPGYGNNPFRVITNQEYYGVDYPPTPATPTSYGQGDYVDETLVMEYIGGWGILNGIVFH